MVKSKDYYIEAYNKAYDECLSDAKELAKTEDDVDIYEVANIMFEDYATAEAIVGYYFMYHKSNPLKDWTYNLNLCTERFKTEETEMDKEVTRILTELFPEG